MEGRRKACSLLEAVNPRLIDMLEQIGSFSHCWFGACAWRPLHRLSGIEQKLCQACELGAVVKTRSPEFFFVSKAT